MVTKERQALKKGGCRFLACLSVACRCYSRCLNITVLEVVNRIINRYPSATRYNGVKVSPEDASSGLTIHRPLFAAIRRWMLNLRLRNRREGRAKFNCFSFRTRTARNSVCLEYLLLLLLLLLLQKQQRHRGCSSSVSSPKCIIN